MVGRIIGTCGKCGGAVAYPRMWGSIRPAKPRCETCGATPANPFGPVIPMEDQSSMDDIFRRNKDNDRENSGW